MNWMFWRRKDIEKARLAKKSTELDQSVVESVVESLNMELDRNHYADRIREAFRGHPA